MVADVVGRAVFVLDDFQTEVGMFAQHGVDGSIVEARCIGVAGGPDDDFGLGLLAEHDEVLGLGGMGACTHVVVQENGPVDVDAVGDENGTAILWCRSL